MESQQEARPEAQPSAGPADAASRKRGKSFGHN
jgi:hypothetical protein